MMPCMISMKTKILSIFKMNKQKNLKSVVSNHPLQSREWGEFRKTWGNKTYWTNYGLLTIHHIPFTKYSVATFEKGPKPTREMLTELKKVGKEKNLIFIKLEPNFPVSINNQPLTIDHSQKVKDLLRNSGAVPGKTLFTPTTFWIDLTKSEDDLMKSFTSKTRYNIRLAERKGVEITEDNSDNAFEKYLELTFETTKRQGFYAHTPKYHRLLWKYLYTLPVSHSSQPIAHLLTACYRNEIITTWIVFTYGDFLYYPYGASTDKYKEVMANNLMMWEAIKFGKKLGLKTFDLWGREEGKGFTKFKEGYSPQIVEFLGTWDLVINKPLYSLYRIAEKIRWNLLRLKAKFFN